MSPQPKTWLLLEHCISSGVQRDHPDEAGLCSAIEHAIAEKAAQWFTAPKDWQP